VRLGIILLSAALILLFKDKFDLGIFKRGSEQDARRLQHAEAEPLVAREQEASGLAVPHSELPDGGSASKRRLSGCAPCMAGVCTGSCGLTLWVSPSPTSGSGPVHFRITDSQGTVVLEDSATHDDASGFVRGQFYMSTPSCMTSGETYTVEFTDSEGDSMDGAIPGDTGYIILVGSTPIVEHKGSFTSPASHDIVADEYCSFATTATTTSAHSQTSGCRPCRGSYHGTCGVSVSIVVDDFPEYVSFKIESGQGEMLQHVSLVDVAPGDTYHSGVSCLERAETYYFTIYDRLNNGMASGSIGSYHVFVGTTEIITGSGNDVSLFTGPLSGDPTPPGHVIDTSIYCQELSWIPGPHYSGPSLLKKGKMMRVCSDRLYK